MELDAWTVLFVVGMGSLLIERVFYYRSKYSNNRKKKTNKSENPNHGERLATLEKGQENIEERLDKIEAKLP